MSEKLNYYPVTVPDFAKLDAIRGKSRKQTSSLDVKYDKQVGAFYRYEEYQFCTPQLVENYKSQYNNVGMTHRNLPLLGINGPKRFSSAIDVRENPDKDPYKTTVIIWSAVSEVKGISVTNFRKDRSIDDSVRANVMGKMSYHLTRTGLLTRDRDRNLTNSHIILGADNEHGFGDFDFQACCSDVSLPINCYFKGHIGYIMKRNKALEMLYSARETLKIQKPNLTFEYYQDTAACLDKADLFIKTDTTYFNCPIL